MIHLLLAGTLLLAVGSGTSDGEAVAKQLASEYAAQTRGNETFVVTTQSDIKGGPIHRTEQSEAIYAMENGSPKDKRVRKLVKNGHTAAVAELERLSTTEDGPISRFGMSAPYAIGSLADYTFAAPRQSGDVFLLDFSPVLHDTFHGSGTITYSQSGNRIIAVTYKPAVLPKEPGSVVITATTIEVAFGQVLPDHWDVVRITRSFAGHEGPFGGHGTVTSSYDGYRIHDGTAAARAAVHALAQ